MNGAESLSETMARESENSFAIYTDDGSSNLSLEDGIQENAQEPSRSVVQPAHHPDEPVIADREETRSHGSARNSTGSSGEEHGAVFDEEAHLSSPTTSHFSDDCSNADDVMSEIPDLYNHGDEEIPSTRQTLSKYDAIQQRSPFRKTSSVRALQMDATPPQTPKRMSFANSNYTRSPRSVRGRTAASSRNGTPKKSPTKKKEYPLVLLHVTLLPVIMPYPTEVIDAVLPPHIMENYNLLKEKVSDTVIERGILLPHPKEDYDLLEDRLLESLELKTPRILKCGHFYLTEEEQAEIEEQGKYESDEEGNEDLDICEDCGRRIRDGKTGSGSGDKRWNIKIFAANGLMRTGAWMAAWREMERVDVEIQPWIPEDLKRELDARRALHQEEQEGEPGEEEIPEDESRLREIYGDAVPEHGVKEETDFSHVSVQQVPLTTLVQNYIKVLARDRRNVAIAVLSFLVLILALTPGSQGGKGKGMEVHSGPVVAEIPLSPPVVSALPEKRDEAVEIVPDKEVEAVQIVPDERGLESVSIEKSLDTAT